MQSYDGLLDNTKFTTPKKLSLRTITFMNINDFQK